MARHHRFSVDIGGGLRGLFRQHVNVFPVLVVLSVFHDRQIDLAELLTNGFKVRAVARIAAVVDLLLRRDEHKAAPQGLIAFEPSTREMACGQHVYRQLIADAH
ncbi:hypothetical protein D3C71_1736620 [compost metagenome]